MTRKVLVVAHGGRQAAVSAMVEAVRELKDVGFEVVLHDAELADALTGTHVARERGEHWLEDIELAVVLGGDGTILRAAELVRGTSVPLFGVNLGHVGFLAESERENLRDAVRRLAAGDYLVERRSALDVEIERPGTDVVHDWALNEATLEKADRHLMVEVEVEIDGQPLSSFGCDGVVMATATGSTAHAFSAGGPVMWPDVEAILIVPLAAHALFARPLVVGPGSTVSVEVTPGSGVGGVVTMDGRRQVEAPAGTRITVRCGASPVLLARLNDAPFTDRLVRKFDLPVAGWRERAALRAERSRDDERPQSEQRLRTGDQTAGAQAGTAPEDSGLAGGGSGA